MNLNLVPYTLETYFSLMVRYVDAFLFVHLLTSLVLIFIVLNFFKPLISQKFLALLMGGLWVFLGLGFYQNWLSELTWAADGFMIVCLLQAALFTGVFWNAHKNGRTPTLLSNKISQIFALLLIGYTGWTGFYPFGTHAFFLLGSSPASILWANFGLLCLLKARGIWLLGLLPTIMALFIFIENWELAFSPNMILICAPLLFWAGLGWRGLSPPQKPNY